MVAIDQNVNNAKILLKTLNKVSKNKSKEASTGVNCFDSMGNTPLHFAGMTGNLEMIKLLVNYGGDPTQKNKNNETPVDVII